MDQYILYYCHSFDSLQFRKIFLDKLVKKNCSYKQNHLKFDVLLKNKIVVICCAGSVPTFFQSDLYLSKVFYSFGTILSGFTGEGTSLLQLICQSLLKCQMLPKRRESECYIIKKYGSRDIHFPLTRTKSVRLLCCENIITQAIN